MASSPDNLAPPPPGVILERGQTIDRFVVLGLVGRGGMGEVYAAYDPELDRKVAIKLLRARGDAGSDGKTRLLREAQAIAKLQHPNVVVVYDVGTFGESVFIAMEFVEGRTVGGWLHAGARTRQEIMQVYLAAGRGLVAAHAAGLVHRDFKPDNVMVTNDGQVRVMDFGLARQMSEREGEGEGEGGQARVGGKAVLVEGSGAASAAAHAATLAQGADVDPDATAKLGAGGGRDVSASGGKYLSLKLTQTGAMMGTPAYMAPEQFAVEPTDARTDQFSFCVALYEALYGKRPFDGDTFLVLMTSVTMGTVTEPPAKSRVPTWMRRVLLRGLQTDPDRRFPSMSVLLAALEKDPTVRPRRLALGVLVTACLVLALVGARRAVGTQQALCRGGDQRLAGTWEPRGVASPRKAAIHQAFLATGKGYAEQAFAGASRFLDDYVGRWVGAYGDACEATHVRGEQSAEVLDLRMGCLQERLRAVRALGDVFVRADAQVVENAVAAASALPRLESCADVALLKSVVKPPEDEATRKLVDALRVDVARLVALRNAGSCAEANRLGDALLPRARAVGYAPLLAETLSATASVHGECVEMALSMARSREAFMVAIAGHHDEAAARAATYVAQYASTLEVRQVQAAREWTDIARAVITRIGGQPQLEAWVVMAEAGALGAERKWVEAIEKYKEERSLLVRLFGKDHPDVFIAEQDIGLYLMILGRYEEALAVDVSARDGFIRLFGPEHPQTAIILNNEAEVLNLLGRHAEARKEFERALEIWRKGQVDPFYVSYGLTGVGTALLGEQRPAEAVGPLEAALRIRIDKHLDAEHLGETRFALARALWSRPADRERARTLARQAKADYAQVTAPTSRVPDIDGWLRAPSARL